MAYAAVVTLHQIVEDILHQHKIPHDQQQIQSLQENLEFFHVFLETSWQKKGSVVRHLERKIKDAAHKAQDTIESYISDRFLQPSDEDGERRREIFIRDLELVADETDSIKKKVSMLMDLWGGATNEQYRAKCSHTRPSMSFASSDDNIMVGFDDDLTQLKEWLTSYPYKLQIIPIVGMGGTGKTTLTKNLYNDDCIQEYFDIRAWVTVSQQYQVRDILLGLLESMKKLNVEMCQKGNDYISECLYKSLKGRRYLIVMDDVWSTDGMYEMMRLFPDDHSGSRIVVTTRLSHVAVYANSHGAHQHDMHFLSQQESWDLLCRKVFAGGRCPPQLQKSGKSISQSCKGLPLAIVVIAGLLVKLERTKCQWEHVAKNVNSIVIENDLQCSNLLSLSYDHLPHHLKACFLYMGVFPEDHAIRASKLIKLWVAEGILKPIDFKSLEEVAEECLEDLVSRNLILAGEKSIDGKIKTCSVHDLLRDLCVRKAKAEKFHLITHMDKLVHSLHLQETIPRRLAIQGDSWNENIAREIHNSIGMFSLVRSLVCPLLPWIFILLCGFFLCKLVRVLELGRLEFNRFPSRILQQVHLRYLCFSCNGNFHVSQFLPDYLWNLQTLIIYQDGNDYEITGTCVFWRMPTLRHLQFKKCHLDCSFPEAPDNEHPVLGNLHTLSNITSSCCTPELFERTPNLKKLGIWIQQSGSDAQFSLGNLGGLPHLKILKFVAEKGASMSIPTDFTLPHNLRKLTLNGTRIPWKDMSMVGSLLNLQVLKLIDNGFEGQEWEPVEGEFGQLKYLLIDGADLRLWKADRDHFPRLEQLSLWDCRNLEEVPCSIGDIPTLNMIELDDASPSAVRSVKKIHEEQQGSGNEQLRVSVLHVWEIIDEMKMERRETEMRMREEQERMREELERMREQERRDEHNRGLSSSMFMVKPRWSFLVWDELPNAAKMHEQNEQSADSIFESWKQREKLQKERLHGMRRVRLQGERMERQRNRMESKWMSKYTSSKRRKL